MLPHEIEIMKDLKKMFDSKGIMNPGKIFSNNTGFTLRDTENAKNMTLLIARENPGVQN